LDGPGFNPREFERPENNRRGFEDVGNNPNGINGPKPNKHIPSDDHF